MAKCSICGNKVQTTFLNKIIGTYQRDSKGKRQPVCQSCQKELTSEEIKEKLA